MYGTCTILICALEFSSSPARWPTAPCPELEKNISPLRFFASAINSRGVFTGKDGCTNKPVVRSVITPSGVKSLMVSKGSVFNSAGFIKKLDEAIIVV